MKAIVLENDIPYCAQSSILSTHPFTISDHWVELPIKECDGLIGQNGAALKAVVSYSDQVGYWVKRNVKGK